MKQSLSYTNNGRSGYVIYKDDKGELSFYYEFGGGNCIASIDVPSVEKWESVTKRLLSERDTIIHFIGGQTVNDQAAGGYYKLSASGVEIYK